MPESKNFATYEKVPLRSDEINIAIVQSKLNILDPQSIEQQTKANLERMLWLADEAQYWDLRRDIKKDLLIFHEFPLQGFKISGDREEQLRLAIDVPGPETEAIGRKAKQYNCYICFGCYGKKKDWPGHFMDMGIIINPKGDIAYEKWKLRQLSGLAFSTTVFDVLPEFVERYGWDAVFPVARTDIGNIALPAEVWEPEISRAFAIQGAEIFIRLLTIGAGYWSGTPLPALRGGPIHSFRLDLQACCMQNQVWGAYVNAAAATEGAIADQASGASAIINPDGIIVSEAMSTLETMVIANIPIAAYRTKHQLPNVPMDLYADMHRRYVPRFPAGSLLKHLPKDPAEAVAYFKKLARY